MTNLPLSFRLFQFPSPIGYFLREGLFSNFYLLAESYQAINQLIDQFNNCVRLVLANQKKTVP